MVQQSSDCYLCTENVPSLEARLMVVTEFDVCYIKEIMSSLTAYTHGKVYYLLAFAVGNIDSCLKTAFENRIELQVSSVERDT